tara:strand:- start:40 stop:1089 length:1050 start_codon:yes stop_codon:yes gene_type:complete
MAYTTIDNPELYFQTKLYTGNGGTQSITLDGSENMQPDWVWLKRRDSADNHNTFDSVRGATHRLITNLNNAQDTVTNMLTSFNSDGFSVGSHEGVNGSSMTYASWNWKAGTSFTNDASATGVGSIDSAGSVNTDAGFSIISFTDGGSNATIAHGLGVVPKVIIIKNRAASEGWYSYWQPLGNDKQLRLNSTAASADAGSMWNDTTPTSSVFSLDTNTAGLSSGNYISYCFAEKKGYSKFGSYTGNGNADGTFVYTGFKPAFVLIKVTSTTNDWEIHDNKRGSSNVINAILQPNLSDAESTSGREIDFLSNGFKLRNSGTQNNLSGGTFIYMAFAESPFVNSNGVPNNSR